MSDNAVFAAFMLTLAVVTVAMGIALPLIH